MTGYTVHTGSTEKFSDGWDRIFGGKPAKTTAGRKKAAGGGRKKAKNKSAKSRAKKKS